MSIKSEYFLKNPDRKVRKDQAYRSVEEPFSIHFNLDRIYKASSNINDFAERLNNIFLIEFICVNLEKEKLGSIDICKDCPPLRCVCFINESSDPLSQLHKQNFYQAIYENLKLNLILLTISSIYFFILLFLSLISIQTLTLFFYSLSSYAFIIWIFSTLLLFKKKNLNAENLEIICGCLWLASPYLLILIYLI